jgi:hypothetical protein
MWTKIHRARQKNDHKTGQKNRPSKTVNESRKQSATSPDGEQLPTPSDQPTANHSTAQPPQPQTGFDDETGYLPSWFDRYVEYKFNLLDRAGKQSTNGN